MNVFLFPKEHTIPESPFYNDDVIFFLLTEGKEVKWVM